MKQFAIAALLAAAMALIVIAVFRSRGSGDAGMNKRIKNFMACLPDTLRDEQRAEIRETFERFLQTVESGIVAPRDRDDVIGILDHYIDRGEISKQELHVFLAKVGYYMIRQTQENQDIEGRMKPPDHPLLETPADSAGR